MQNFCNKNAAEMRLTLAIVAKDSFSLRFDKILTFTCKKSKRKRYATYKLPNNVSNIKQKSQPKNNKRSEKLLTRLSGLLEAN